MPGYKNTVLNDLPLAFWTFDGDTFDPSSRVFTNSPVHIIDEINNQNPAIMQGHTTTSPYGYRAGMPSMIDLEPGNQQSISFGYYGQQSGQWPKSYLEVPHSNTFALDDEYGSWTLEFMMYKDSDLPYRTATGDHYFNRPIMKKEGVFDVYTYYNYYTASENYFYVKFPDNYVAAIRNTDYQYIGKKLHVVIVWDVNNTEQDVYTATRKIYFNNRLIHSSSAAFQDSPPECTHNTPIYIGGWAGSCSDNCDRNTSNLQLDQIAIYGRPLIYTDIARHYRKIRHYDDMILNEYYIGNYWTLGDSNDPLNFNATNSTGGWAGYYSGGVTTISRDQPGPEKIINSRSAYFKDETQFWVRETSGSVNYDQPIFNIGGNYAVEFWFKTQTKTMAALFCAQQDQRPFRGVMVWLNKNGKNVQPGYLEFYETQDDRVTCAGDYTDGLWHHLVVQRNGNSLEVWIDGNMAGYKANVAPASMGMPGQIYMMNTRPGYFGVEGYICKVAQYNVALQQQQILARAHNSVIYKIEGNVTLRGVPYNATIRIYHHTSGQLIDEIESEVATGNYVYYLPTNSPVDLVIFDRDDSSVRFRSFGPIVPAECEDPTP